MKRSRLEILLILVAVLALSAGVVAGLLAARLPASGAGDGMPPAPPSPGAMERSLAEELHLSTDQREKMKTIWEGVHGQVHRTFDDAQTLEKQRDDALVALLNDEQKAKFEKISMDFADRFDTLAKRRNEIFEKAVAETNLLLDEGQRQKYREILKRHVRPEPPSRGRVFTAPASQPAAQRAN